MRWKKTFPSSGKHRLADADYNGRQRSAVTQDGDIYSCEFRPEKKWFREPQDLKNIFRNLID